MQGEAANDLADAGIEEQMTIGSLPEQPRALVADDQADVLEALRLLLKREGFEIELATSPAGVLAALERGRFDVLLMDLNYARDTTSGREGLDLLNAIRKRDRELPIVAMTAWGSVELAVEAMQRGVGDFVLKPWENARLLRILRAQMDEGRVRRDERQRAAEGARNERRQREEEFSEARELQKGFLPQQIPQVPGFSIAAEWIPARSVGGDYFDVLALEGGRLAVCIADVVGKGVPAALLMSNLQAAVRGLSSNTVAPAELADKVNALMCRNLSADKFITFFYGVLDPAGRQMIYTNAGHNAPLIVRRNGADVRLGEGGQVLGMFPEAQFEEGAVAFQRGDRVAFFTDGVTEVRNASGEEFGEARLAALVRMHAALGAEELQRTILADVAAFSGREYEDDATLIVIAVE